MLRPLHFHSPCHGGGFPQSSEHGFIFGAVSPNFIVDIIIREMFLSEDLKAICLQFEHTTDFSQVVKKSRPNLLFHLEKLTLCLAFDPRSPLGVLLCRLTQGHHTKSRCFYSWLSLNPCKLSSAISDFSITCPPQPRVTIGTFFIGLHHSLTNTL